uniref:Uncharacterized protein n=1 Tax=Lotus japonicus TaxID=34305 RepID=I3S2Z6_LOTJA|nr:unknown [Lotus japonicus]AFK41710.1 unknown [Lotus japonicus]
MDRKGRYILKHHYNPVLHIFLYCTEITQHIFIGLITWKKQLEKNSWQQNIITLSIFLVLPFYTKVQPFSEQEKRLLSRKPSFLDWTQMFSLISIDSEYPNLVHIRELCNN